jgi:hypothetical protein
LGCTEKGEGFLMANVILTRVDTQKLTYCFTEKSISSNDEWHDFYEVTIKKGMMEDIKLAHTEMNYLPARTLLHLKMLLEKLEKEGYKLSYKMEEA